VNHKQRNHSIPRICAVMTIAALCGLPSCEKARELAGKMKEKSSEAASSASGGFVTRISAGDFDSFRTQPGKVVVIDFYADWCGPCRNLAPILDRVANDHGGVVLVGKVNVDQNRELAASEGVRGIPDVRIFRDGREVDRFVGLPGEDEVRRRIEIHTKGLSATDSTVPAGETPAAPEPNIAPAPKDWLPPGMQRR
jgi:thioredoxin